SGRNGFRTRRHHRLLQAMRMIARLEADMDQDIRFGGAAAISAIPVGIPGLPATPEEFQRRYADRIARRPPWWELQDQAFLQLRATPEGKRTYGDPQRGATLPQAWRTSVAMSGILSVCLLVQGRQPTPTEDIANVVLIAPADLVGTLARGFATLE